MQSGVYIGLGSNLGNRLVNIQDAVDQIMLRIGQLIAMSAVYESPPMGFYAVQDFYNQVIEVETEMNPKELLNELLVIERKLGRERSDVTGYESRTIDLDLLFYSDLVLDEPGIQVPHPSIPLRRFVTLPLSEIASEFLHPVLQKTMKKMNDDCPDPNPIKRVE